MPTYRPDLDDILTYEPGKPIEEVSRELGIDEIVKLASNESPTEPFPEVQQALGESGPGLNRYPETHAYYLVQALADFYDVSPEELWVGAGSTSILVSVALATLPPGRSSVFAHQSFVMYPIATAMAGGEAIRVPLDSAHRHDPDAMAAAVREDTTLLYYCNPNNPTGTHTPAEAVARLVERVPERVLIVIDEAYAEYVTAPDFESAIPIAVERDNVIVTRTFSKVYGLAGMRIGYAIGSPGTLRSLRRLQVPFATTAASQAAALEALKHQDRVAERAKENARGIDQLSAGLRERETTHIDSQTNFVLFRPPSRPGPLAAAMQRRGVIVRPMGEWVRVSVGTSDENERFFAALDDAARELA